jgi:hypothetical protein
MTSTATHTRPQASGGQVITRYRSNRRPILGSLWNALADSGKRRAHREVAYLLQARGAQVTGDFDRDLQRYVELTTVRSRHV